MKILQSGIPKSGNYWLYTINRHLIEKSDIKYSSYIKNQPIYNIAKKWDLSQSNQSEVDVLDIEPGRIINRISRIYEMPIDDFQDYLSQTTISWTHSRFYNECVNFYKKFDKIVYIIRDPRAVAISAAKFQNKEYSKKYLGRSGIDPQRYLNINFEFMIKSWADDIIAFLELFKELDVYPLFYENLKQNTSSEIKGLANYLEISITEEELNEIVESVSLESMKKNNPKHIRKGKLYEWKNKLSYWQKKKVDIIVGSLLDSFKYPRSGRKYPHKVGLKDNLTNKKISKLKKWVYFATLLTTGHKMIGRKISNTL